MSVKERIELLDIGEKDLPANWPGRSCVYLGINAGRKVLKARVRADNFRAMDLLEEKGFKIGGPIENGSMLLQAVQEIDPNKGLSGDYKILRPAEALKRVVPEGPVKRDVGTFGVVRIPLTRTGFTRQ